MYNFTTNNGFKLILLGIYGKKRKIWLQTVGSIRSKTVSDRKVWFIKKKDEEHLHYCLYCLYRTFNPFPCGSLWNAHRGASGPISLDKTALFGLGLFWPVPPIENTSPHSCGPIGQAPSGALLIWACKMLRSSSSHSPPPPDILCCHTELQKKLVLAFTQRFGHEDFILWKGLSNVLERAWTRLYTVSIFKIIFTNNKVTAL